MIGRPDAPPPPEHCDTVKLLIMQAHLEVEVPEGKKSGDMMLFMIPGGQHMKVQIPADVKAGEKMRVQIPTSLNPGASPLTLQKSMAGGQNMFPVQSPMLDVNGYNQYMPNFVPRSGPGTMLISTTLHRYCGSTTMAFCFCTPLGWCCIPLCFHYDDQVTVHVNDAPV